MGRPVGRGGQLRSRLLVGVAATALAVPMAYGAHAQTQDSAKWSPYVEAGGMGGNTHSWGDVDIFLPLWQDQGSLLFGDLRGTFTAQPTEEGNFGLGYRTQISPEWILGGYGYFDIANSANDNLFYQVTLGGSATVWTSPAPPRRPRSSTPVRCDWRSRTRNGARPRVRSTPWSRNCRRRNTVGS